VPDRPVVRIDIAPSASSGSEPAIDPVVFHRSLIGPLLQAVRSAAPDAALEIAEADLQLRAPSMPDVRVSDLSLRARADASGVDLEATGPSTGR
jgi:hypothetical protein